MEKISDALTEENRVMVLDDHSTCGGVIDSHIVWFSGVEAEEEFVDCERLSRMSDGSIKYALNVKDLLECWMEKYGEDEFIPFSSKS